ncbi:MAG: DNA repair protein RecO [Chloroflexi bacterium]|nr:DNA repair protein RecO [Chloroflexota bacterium]
MNINRSRIYKTDVIILKQAPFLEKDRLITAYSDDYGKLKLIAKGIRSPKSKFGGSLETLNSVSLTIIKRNSLDLITESYTNTTYLNIRNNLSLLSKSMYWIELIDSLSVENEPIEKMFSLTEFTLNLINENQCNDLSLRYLELKLITITGYFPEIFKCIYCRDTLIPKDHYFSFKDGGVFCEKCTNHSSSSLLKVTLDCMKLLRYLNREKDITKIQNLEIDKFILIEIEKFFISYLKYILEKDIKSYEFIKSISNKEFQ